MGAAPGGQTPTGKRTKYLRLICVRRRRRAKQQSFHCLSLFSRCLCLLVALCCSTLLFHCLHSSSFVSPPISVFVCQSFSTSFVVSFFAFPSIPLPSVCHNLILTHKRVNDKQTNKQNPNPLFASNQDKESTAMLPAL